jgi:hypothetical protein
VPFTVTIYRRQGDDLVIEGVERVDDTGDEVRIYGGCDAGSRAVFYKAGIDGWDLAAEPPRPWWMFWG